MAGAFHNLSRAFKLWWQDSFVLSALNVVWLLLQIPIVTGPPATAAMYSVTQRSAADEAPTYGQYWQAFRTTFGAAWKWGAVNLVFLFILLFNFISYQESVGLGFTLLRVAWASMALAWFSGNAFYWPFWLRQADKSMLTTLKNCFIFLARKPALGLTTLFITLFWLVISVLLFVPVIFLFMAVASLLGSLAVEAELKRGEPAL